jgi:predicted lipoprotein with Yx(FWY)xxD motif
MIGICRRNLPSVIALSIAAFVLLQAPVTQASAATVGVASAAPTFQNGILVDAQGMTLYVFSKDTKGTSNCNGACAENWPPLLAAAGAAAQGDFSIIDRSDGSKQWAYKGQPLYLFKNDTAPGQQNGNGFKGLWSVVKPAH